jgi:hypothetical protein
LAGVATGLPHAGEAHHGVLPQGEVVPHQVHLGLGEAIGIGQQLAHHVHEGLGDAQLVGGGGDALLDLLLDVIGQQLGGPLRDFGVGLGDFFGVRQFGLGNFFSGAAILGLSSLLMAFDETDDPIGFP